VRSVVATSECPSTSATVRTSTPRDSMSVAVVCRRSWNRTGRTPARPANFRHAYGRLKRDALEPGGA